MIGTSRAPRGCWLKGPLVAIVAVGLSLCTQAEPIERFQGLSEYRCAGATGCATVGRSPTSLGGRVGISFPHGGAGGVEVSAQKGEQSAVKVSFKGTGPHTVQLTWDGDSNPRRLSSAGLGCRNLRADGSSVIRLAGLSLQGTCPAGADNSCRSVRIESRIYDGRDPTGQRYAASVVHRQLPAGRVLIEIPFSNFIHAGIHGAASFECVGALSIGITLEDARAAVLELGSVAAIGRGAASSLGSAHEGSAVAPTVAPTVQEVAPQAVQGSATPTPIARRSVTPMPALKVVATPVGAPSKGPTPLSRTAAPKPTRVPTVVATASPAESSRQQTPPAIATAEVTSSLEVFGATPSMPAEEGAATPSPAPRRSKKASRKATPTVPPLVERVYGSVL